MRWDRSQDEDGRLNEINMTPLIDVSLVLVLILLLATPMAFESAFGLSRARASAQRAGDASETARVELELVSATQVRVNRDLVAVADLGAALRPLLDEGATPQVTIACADSVTHGVFVEVLDVTKTNGAQNIAVIGR
jgi:biopolymer transport protein ExbD